MRTSLSRSRGPPPARSRSRSDSSAASSAAERRRAELARLEQHVRQPRMRGKFLHRAAVRGDLPGVIERAERRSRSRALASVAAGGASSQRSAPASRAPHRQIERERREIRDADFRRRVRGETALGALAPQPIAHARRRATRAARALLGRGARDALHFEPVHAARRIEQAAPLEARSRRRCARRRS